jgi:serine/threonine-protein kinase
MLFVDAEALLVQRGFKVKRLDAFDPVVKRLHVISQSLEEGVLVQRGATVTLTVSKGPELVRVPDVVGDPAVSARADLVAAGFDVTERHELSETVPAGDVVSQSLKAGARVKKGSTITIVISDGPPLVEVPNLDCMRRAQAEEALQAKGFKATFEGSGSYVVDQDPGAGTKAPKGSTVTAFLSIGNRCT